MSEVHTLATPEFTPEELATEEWRLIPTWEDVYSVSSLGRVKRTAPSYSPKCPYVKGGNFMKPHLESIGYYTVNLSRGGHHGKRNYIHRLVAWAFLGPQVKGMTVNHINGIKTDNRRENLEYVTHGDNMRHARRLNLMGNVGDNHFSKRHPETVMRGTGHCFAKLTEEAVRYIRSVPQDVVNYYALGQRFGVSRATVRDVYLRNTWKHIY